MLLPAGNIVMYLSFSSSLTWPTVASVARSAAGAPVKGGVSIRATLENEVWV